MGHFCQLFFTFFCVKISRRTRDRTSKRPNSRRISESETLNVTPTPSGPAAADAPCHTDNQQEVKGAEEGRAPGSESHQTVEQPPPERGATKIAEQEGGRGEREKDSSSVEEDKSWTTCSGENKQTVSRDAVEMRQNGPESKSGQSVSPTTELSNDKAVNNNKLLVKSDSGFSEQQKTESSRRSLSGTPKQPVAIENVKAIYKSDSGYSEPGVVASSEDEDVASPAKSKQISVEQAHTLFNKRYAAMLLQGQDDLATGPAPTAVRRPPNAIVEDSEEDSDEDEDESDDDSVEGRDKTGLGFNLKEKPVEATKILFFNQFRLEFF